MKKLKQATDDEILGEHLPYELWMLRETFEKLETRLADGVVQNALIESFCIHARQLIDFFENRQGKKAKEYTGGNYIAAHLSYITSKERNKMNTQIAHITERRTVDPAHKIDQEFRRKLLNAIIKEEKHLRSQLDPKFHTIFKQI